MRWMVLIALLAAWPADAAVDSGFERIRTILTGMRGKRGGARGATPQLTLAKHAQRDWVEARLGKLAFDGDTRTVEVSLNTQLRQAGLLCQLAAPGCSERTLLGYAGEVRLHMRDQILWVKTGVGIECGFDESVYIYRHTDGAWRRVLASEQNTYTDQAYHPQQIVDVKIAAAGGELAVLTMGRSPWCGSMWHPVYYRGFKTSGNGPPRLVLDESESAYMGGEQIIQGDLTMNDVLVEYSAHGEDHHTQAVRHYRIDREPPLRVDPLAISPRGFIATWNHSDWKSAAEWSEEAHREAMREWHARPGKPFPLFDAEPSRQCVDRPDLWQVAVPMEKEGGTLYYLLRWTPPYRFRMVNVGTRPEPGCTRRDDSVDADRVRTLFGNRP